MRDPLPRLAILAAAFALLAAGGCATKRYVGPTTGRSADMQRATSAALDKALRSQSFAGLAGKRCLLDVVSLAENFGGESPENMALRGAFAEKLLQEGVVVVTDPAQAEVRLAVRARVVGVNVVRRDFPPLYYRESTQAAVDLHVTAYDARDAKILDQKDLRGGADLAQSYYLYMIGPFESQTAE